jgi:hypothetical protein
MTLATSRVKQKAGVEYDVWFFCQVLRSVELSKRAINIPALHRSTACILICLIYNHLNSTIETCKILAVKLTPATYLKIANFA